MINVGAVFRKRGGGGGWSGLVSHACPKQGLVKAPRHGDAL